MVARLELARQVAAGKKETLALAAAFLLLGSKRWMYRLPALGHIGLLLLN
ncbi:MAG: hypothetical protein HY233_04670 [Acidobacteriales bacterium]|nr:hypothetical protein [Terriglobales bacterium]